MSFITEIEIYCKSYQILHPVPMRNKLWHDVPGVASLVAEGANVERFLGFAVDQLHDEFHSNQRLRLLVAQRLKVGLGGDFLLEAWWHWLTWKD